MVKKKKGDDQPMVAANSSRQLARCRTSTVPSWVEKQGGNLSSSRKQGFILGTRIEKQKKTRIFEKQTNKKKQESLKKRKTQNKNP